MLFELDDPAYEAAVMFSLNEALPATPDTGWPGYLFDSEDKWPPT